MKNVIIIGSNSIAINIAETLCKNPNINLYIIESSFERYMKINDTLDAEFIFGDAIDPEILLRANIKECDILLALSDSDTINITISLLARHFNEKVKIINHIDKNSDDNYKILNKDILNIDNFISPEKLTAEHISHLIKHPGMIEYHKIVNGKFFITAFEITLQSPILGKKLSDLKEFLSEYSMLIVGISSNDNFDIPKGDTLINEHDVLYILVAQKHIVPIFEHFGIKGKKINTILVGGGGRYSEALLDKIYKQNYEITVIEHSKRRIEYLKEIYPEVNFLHLDIRNLDRVESQHLFDVDLYISMTDDDNTNFISSVYASNSSEEVMSIYLNQKSFELFTNHKIKNLINPKSLVVDELLSYFHIGKIISISSLWNEEVEMVEFIPSKNSKLMNKTLKDINLNLLIGVIVHNGVAYIANGNSVIKENDKILFFAKKSQIEGILKDIN